VKYDSRNVPDSVLLDIHEILPGMHKKRID